MTRVRTEDSDHDLNRVACNNILILIPGRETVFQKLKGFFNALKIALMRGDGGSRASVVSDCYENCKYFGQSILLVLDRLISEFYVLAASSSPENYWTVWHRMTMPMVLKSS